MIFLQIYLHFLLMYYKITLSGKRLGVNMKKNIKAFTIMEICLVMVIIGAFFLVLKSSFNRGALDEKKLIIQSHTFYSEVQKALIKIAFEEAKDEGLKSFTSEQLAQRLSEYLTGEYKFESAAEVPESEVAESEVPESGTGEEEETEDELSCSKFKVDLEQENFDKIPAIGTGKCFTTPQDFLAAVVVDSTCKTTVFVKEYYGENNEMRQAKNVCGYIVYEPTKNAEGVFEKDLFVIPFGSRGVK